MGVIGEGEEGGVDGTRGMKSSRGMITSYSAAHSPSAFQAWAQTRTAVAGT